ncbi:hypothetical protein LA080_008869 [Diaporthe eres]|uniref:Uncharacterized protein n=1 Tax=Diaporthe vaccinii TaxID=105482 RepID=A0ABR4DQS4_9PEZI|nr:hypothetical protein LA080_008869 [Diaporthe eres]
MKCAASIILAMGAAVLANPMPKNGNNAAAAAGGKNNANGNVDAALQQKVAGTIQNWLNDIAAVNSFVDTAGQLQNNQDISDAAAQAFVAAQDEGTSNTDLGNDVQLDASGLAASQALQDQFNIIGPAINDTISNPQNLQKNLDAINGARCPPPAGNGAIFEEAAVQQSAAAAAGIQAATPALPNACQVLAQKQVDAAGKNNNNNANAADANAADANAADANAADANADCAGAAAAAAKGAAKDEQN